MTNIENVRNMPTIDEDKLEAIKYFFPEILQDGQINISALSNLINPHDSTPIQKAYEINWPGKAESRRLSSQKTPLTLRRVDNFALKTTPDNCIIVGDNLSILRILRLSYSDRIKLIYIDPPYNTGSDLVYNDDFSESKTSYLLNSQQSDEMGLLTSNPKSSGRFHSKWLNMMLPRLRLARELLRDDGFIAISIDDNELYNLKLLMDELFGEENYVSTIISQVNPRGRHLDEYIAKTHEYILIYAKNKNDSYFNGLPKDERMSSEYNKIDERGRYREIGLRNRNPNFNRQTRPNLYFPIYINPASGKVALIKDEEHSIEALPRNSEGGDSCWTWGTNKVSNESDLLYGRQNNKGEWQVFRKDYYESEDGQEATTKAKSIWNEPDINNDQGKKAIQDLFGENVFDFPKPVGLIKRLIQITCGTQDIVLDFFAGSGTTAEAVYQINSEFDTNRKYILTQIDESPNPGTITFNAGFKKISDMTIARADKARIKHKSALETAVFETAPTNILSWRSADKLSVEAISNNLFTSVLVGDYKSHDVIIELLLLEGFPLDSEVRQAPEFDDQVYVVSHPERGYRLLITLTTDRLLDSTVDLAIHNPKDTFICLESSLTDQSKIRLADAVAKVKTL